MDNWPKYPRQWGELLDQVCCVAVLIVVIHRASLSEYISRP